MFFLFHDWFSMKFEIFLWSGVKLTQNTKSLLVLIKKRLKAQEKNMSCERALNFDQWKIFSENYEPMRV